MSRSYDKRFLNCNASFADINEKNVARFIPEFKGTWPVVFVEDKFKAQCFYAFGGNVMQNVSCNKKNDDLGSEDVKDLIHTVQATYIRDNNLSDSEHKEEFANIKIQEELCQLYQEHGSEDMFATVATIVGLSIMGAGVVWITLS